MVETKENGLNEPKLKQEAGKVLNSIFLKKALLEAMYKKEIINEKTYNAVLKREGMK